MKITSMDLQNCSTYSFQLLQRLTERAQYLQKQAERVEELNQCLIHNIHEGIITDTDEVNAAIAWLNQTTLTPDEIMEKILQKD